MQRRLLLLLLMFCLCFAGCEVQSDPFISLREGYAAEVEGSLHGMPFCALVEADRVNDGVLPITVTFYAPDALLGTKIVRRVDGTVGVTCGDIEVAVSGEAFGDLLRLFEPGAQIQEIYLNEEGRSVVTGEGFCMEFLSDGTPYQIERGDASARIVYFEKK